MMREKEEKMQKPFILSLVASIIASNATWSHGSKESTQGGGTQASEETCSQGSKEGRTKAQDRSQGSKAPIVRYKHDEHVSW